MRFAARRRVAQAGRATAALAIVLLLLQFMPGCGLQGGVYGRDGDLLLGIYPGQLRFGWSQDWGNRTSWKSYRAEFGRNAGRVHWGIEGGNSFTATAPYEIAVDLPILALLPLLLGAAAWFHHRTVLLKRWRVCQKCGYPEGSSAACPECGAPATREDARNGSRR